MYYLFYVSLFFLLSISVKAGLPDKVYGVSLGSWWASSVLKQKQVSVQLIPS